MSAHADLPDDIDTLKAIIAERDAVVATLREQLSTRTAEIEHLKLTIAKLRRMQFGRKSEKLDRQIDQLELRLEDLQADEGQTASRAQRQGRPFRAPAQKKPLPAHLPREEQVHAPAEDACPSCGGALKPLGEDVSEQLEFVPARFKVIRHVRPKLACSCCDCIVQAAAPSRPIERGLPGPGLLAHVLVGKFADHLPLYRQSVIYARDGVTLPRSLLADWVGACGDLLAPLVEAVGRHVVGTDKVHADDTPMPVLAPGLGKTKTGRLWTYVRDDRPAASQEAPAVWFAYTPDRKGIHPQEHLKGFAGILQADAYAGFGALYESGAVKEAACWAHARRKFYDLHVARPSAVTAEALERIGHCMRSKPKSAASRQTSGGKCGRHASSHCWPTSRHGCARRWQCCRGNPIRPRRSCTRSIVGSHSFAMPTMAVSRSITRPPSVLCAAWRSGAAITCSPVPIPAASAPPPCTP